MLQLNTVILTDMKKELEKLQPDISNIIYRGLAKFVPDHKINLVDDVATDLVEYISERLVKNNGVLDDVSGSTETDEQKNCEHEYYDTYFCNADGESFELDDIKCIKCGKIDLEI